MFDFKSLSYYYYFLKGSSQFGLPRQLLGPCYAMAINWLFYMLGLAIYIFKKYVKANEELWKLKYFTMQKYNLQKIL